MKKLNLSELCYLPVPAIWVGYVFGISEVPDWLCIWIPLKYCLRGGCIALSRSPEFFGNRYGDFIGCPFIWNGVLIRIRLGLEAPVRSFICSRYTVSDNVLLPIHVFRILYRP